jgi:hypothetical protein
MIHIATLLPAPEGVHLYGLCLAVIAEAQSADTIVTN